MKTLKKTLCLVLAVVMVVGVLILPAYAADSYTAATNAMQNYGVLQGYPDGLLHEDANITRGQMAAIVYRIMTGDIESTDAQVAVKYGNYANIYTDADVAPWAKGYIGWCSNQGVLKGYPGGTVQANKQISGYEVQAMLLRALGYDKNNEYTGDNWKFNVLSDATKSGINKNVNDISPEKVTPRGAVAQYTYDATRVASRVDSKYQPTTIKLINVTSAKVSDVWGTPSTKYTCIFTWPDVTTQYENTVPDEALVEYDAPVTECDVAEALGIKTGNFVTYTNGYYNAGTQYIDRLDTTNYIGAQGRHVAIYDAVPDDDDTPDTIVYKDTVLVKVNSPVAATYDTNGHEITPASTTVTVYGNVNMEGVHDNTTAIPLKPGNGVKSTVGYKISGTYKKDQILAVNILTGTADNGVNSAGVPKDPSTGKTVTYRAQNAKELTAVSVTVAGIKYDGEAATQNPIGFVGTNGVTYLYDVSYGYYDGDVAKATDVLTNTAIGKTYSVYTDGHNNVLGIVPSATDSGVGVVTGFKLVSLGTLTGTTINYAVDYEILGADGTTKTVRAYKDGTSAFAGETEAVADVVKNLNRLVSYSVPDTTDAKYITVTAASTAINLPASGLEIGDAEALGTGKIVNDGTVFFVANYKMDNSLDNGKGAYAVNGYSVYTGFQNLPYDLKYGGVKIYEGETAASVTGMVCYAMNSSKKDLGASGTAKYVLVLYGTEQTTNTVETVANYAYIQYKDDMYTAYQDYYLFNVLTNGVASTLKMANTSAAVGKVQQNGTGLYTYADATTNGTYGTVKGPVNEITVGNKTWTYGSGVLDLGAGNTVTDYNGTGVASDQYLTVAKDAQIYIVNPTTGASYKFNGDLKAVHDVYKASTTGVKMYFQLNQYGWINFVYVVDNMTGGTYTTPTTSTINYTLNIVNPITGVINSTYTKTYEEVTPVTFTPDLAVLAADLGIDASNLARYGTIKVNGSNHVGAITMVANTTYNIVINAYYTTA